MLMDRASRLSTIVNSSGHLSLLTGGERRYSKYLFEICHELIKDDITSDSTKVLKEGVLVKIKNKGSKPTKEKYESSVR